MRLTGIMVCVSLLVALPLSAARADDPCLGDEEQKNAKAAAAALKRAEQAGKPGELFVVYRSILGNDCIDQYDKSAWDRAKANVPKLGRELAKAAEAKACGIRPTRCAQTARPRRFNTSRRSVSMAKPTG
ncbi:MAG: hypothetical protein U0231_18715 [Nitrospiraceae bacterium]